jgi:hypothetical protein
MANPNSVATNLQDDFGNYRFAMATQVPLSANGNAVVVMPILGSGLTPTTGGAIIRRITVANPSNAAGGAVPNMAAANVTVLTSSDGNTSNAVTTTGGQTLANITASGAYQDLTLATATGQFAISSGALFLKVNANVANAVVQVSVYGDVVQF